MALHQLLYDVSPAGAYTTLSPAVNHAEANFHDLVTDEHYIDFEISGDWSGGADTTEVVVHNFDTDGFAPGDNGIRIYTTGAARHKGKYSTSYYILDASPSTSAWILVSSPNVSIDGIQFVHAGTGQDGATMIRFSDLVGNIRISNNIMKGNFSSYWEDASIRALNNTGSSYLWNNIIYGFNAGIYIDPSGDGSHNYVYNNTVYNCTICGIELRTAHYVVINNICTTNGTADYSLNSTLDAVADNISTDTSSPNDEWDSITLANIKFVSTTIDGTEDFHLQSGSAAIDVGTSDPGSGLFSDDIDGVTRSGTWDIGADEYFALTNFSRGDYAALPSTEADLENIYTSGEISQVASDNADRVSQSAIAQYAIHQYKTDVGVNTSWTFHWNGQSSLAPSTSVVKLQIYDIEGTTWEDLDEDNAAAANTDFDLTATVTSDLDHYKDVNNVVTCRVYQQWHE